MVATASVGRKRGAATTTAALTNRMTRVRKTAVVTNAIGQATQTAQTGNQMTTMIRVTRRKTRSVETPMTMRRMNQAMTMRRMNQAMTRPGDARARRTRNNPTIPLGPAQMMMMTGPRKITRIRMTMTTTTGTGTTEYRLDITVALAR